MALGNILNGISSVASPFTAATNGTIIPPQQLAGITSQLGSIGAPIVDAAGTSAPGLLGRIGVAGGLGGLARAGGYGLAGQLASGIFDKAIGGEKDGTWDNAASDALAGAGLGAGIGSVIPVVGTGLGALLGGIGGGLVGAIWGDRKSDATKRAELRTHLTNFAGQLGLSAESQKSVANQLAAIDYATKDPKQREAAYNQIASALPALADQEAQQKRQLSNLLASQQVLAPAFDNFLKGLGAKQDAFQHANSDFANIIAQANPAAGAFIKQQGAASVLSDSATAAAYKNQLGGQVQQLAGQINAPESITQQLMAQYG